MRKIAFGALATFCAFAASAAETVPEVAGVATIPDAMQRVYVADPVLPHMVDGRIYVLDGATLELRGMLEAGFAGMMVAAPEKHRVYVASTFFERLTRGKRTDVIQVFDDRTLKVLDEIPVPDVRAQALPYRSLMQPSRDGAFLFVQNTTPASSVTVVDVAAKTQFETAESGCYGIYPALRNAMRFATLCGDGTIGTYTIADDHRSARRAASAKLFDPQNDALFSHAERDNDGYVFVSYSGRVVRISMDGDTAALLDSADVAGAAKGWAPGGFQPFAFDAKAGVVYILMHPNAAEGSHKNPSAEIWSYDVRNKHLLARSPAANFTSLTISPSDPLALFAINTVESKIVRLAVDAKTRGVSPVREIKLGETAALIEVPQ